MFVNAAVLFPLFFGSRHLLGNDAKASLYSGLVTGALYGLHRNKNAVAYGAFFGVAAFVVNIVKDNKGELDVHPVIEGNYFKARNVEDPFEKRWAELKERDLPGTKLVSE